MANVQRFLVDKKQRRMYRLQCVPDVFSRCHPVLGQIRPRSHGDSADGVRTTIWATPPISRHLASENAARSVRRRTRKQCGSILRSHLFFEPKRCGKYSLAAPNVHIWQRPQAWRMGRPRQAVSEIYEPFARHGSAEQALRACLERVWGQYLWREGFNEEACPWNGSLD